MASQFGRLTDRERSELEVCKQNIELFRKYIQDFDHLKARLSNFADKTQHEIMVPIAGSKLAFMPGYVHHTNEILVLLGDNYFVEKSTKEAGEFVDRRMAFCKNRLQELEAQSKMLTNWITATEDMKNETEQLVDITETCTEEEYESWKKTHDEKMREYRKQLKKEASEHEVDLNAIFAKYEKLEDELSSKVKIGSSQGDDKPLRMELVERTGAAMLEPQQTQSNLTSTRPVSRFKASRNQQ